MINKHMGRRSIVLLRHAESTDDEASFRGTGGLEDMLYEAIDLQTILHSLGDQNKDDLEDIIRELTGRYKDSDHENLEDLQGRLRVFKHSLRELPLDSKPRIREGIRTMGIDGADLETMVDRSMKRIYALYIHYKLCEAFILEIVAGLPKCTRET